MTHDPRGIGEPSALADHVGIAVIAARVMAYSLRRAAEDPFQKPLRERLPMGDADITKIRPDGLPEAFWRAEHGRDLVDLPAAMLKHPDAAVIVQARLH
jgi:hypothetical protein